MYIMNCMKKIAKIVGLKKLCPPPTHTYDLLRNIPAAAEKFAFQILLTGHCNKGCSGCAVFSPLAKPSFASLEDMEKDLHKISLLCQTETESITLLGGEPLLHPQLISFFKVTRKYFPKTEIRLVTNSILLLKQNSTFWEEMRKNSIILAPTYYEDVDFDPIVKKAKSENIDMGFYQSADAAGKPIPRVLTKYVLDLEGSQVLKDIKDCLKFYLHLATLSDGKLWICSMPSVIHYFNEYFGKNIEISEKDFLEVSNITSFDEIMEYMRKPVPFCRYCKQSEWNYALPYQRTKRQISEWV